MKKKFNFVYITANLINGKQYVGEHSTDNLEKDNYLGSGRLFSQKVKQYGRKNFKKEILEIFPTKQEAFDAQKLYINLYKTHISQGGYNKDWTGGWCADKDWSEERRKNHSTSLIGRKSPFEGRRHSFGAIQIIKAKRALQIPWNKDKTGYQVAWNKELKMSEEFCNKISRIQIGKKHSEEQNINHSKKMKGKSLKVNNIKKECEYCGIITNLGNYGKWHGEKCKNRLR